VQQNTRIPFGLSAVLTVAGTWDVGLCGDANNDANWNSNEWGYTSVIVAEY
jgi:hypothetical protein